MRSGRAHRPWNGFGLLCPRPWSGGSWKTGTSASPMSAASIQRQRSNRTGYAWSAAPSVCAILLWHAATYPVFGSHRQRPVRLPVTSLRAPRPFHRVLDRRPRDEEPIPTPPSMAIWPLQAAAPQPGCSRPLFFSLYRETWYVLRTISTFLSPNPGRDPNRQALRPSLPCRRRATRSDTLWICAKTTGARCGMFPRSITSLDAKSGRGRALRFLNHRHTPSQIHKSVERM